MVTSAAIEFIASSGDCACRQMRPAPGGYGSTRCTSRPSGCSSGALAARRSSRPVPRGPAPTITIVEGHAQNSSRGRTVVNVRPVPGPTRCGTGPRATVAPAEYPRLSRVRRSDGPGPAERAKVTSRHRVDQLAQRSHQFGLPGGVDVAADLDHQRGRRSGPRARRRRRTGCSGPARTRERRRGPRPRSQAACAPGRCRGRRAGGGRRRAARRAAGRAGRSARRAAPRRPASSSPVTAAAPRPEVRVEQRLGVRGVVAPDPLPACPVRVDRAHPDRVISSRSSGNRSTSTTKRDTGLTTTHGRTAARSAAASASASVRWSVSAATSAASSPSSSRRCARDHAGTRVPACGTCSSTRLRGRPGGRRWRGRIGRSSMRRLPRVYRGRAALSRRAACR